MILAVKLNDPFRSRRASHGLLAQHPRDKRREIVSKGGTVRCIADPLPASRGLGVREDVSQCFELLKRGADTAGADTSSFNDPRACRSWVVEQVAEHRDAGLPGDRLTCGGGVGRQVAKL